MLVPRRYFPHSTFLEAKKGSRPSWIWNSLLAGREVIDRKAVWRVGNGLSIDVWSDKWMSNVEGGVIKPIIISNRFTPLSVADVIDESRNWNISHLEPFLTKSDIQVIKAIPIGGVRDYDKLVWPMNKDGSFSVKSGYKQIFSEHIMKFDSSKASSSHSINSQVWKVIWKPSFMPNVSNLLWKTLNNGLSTAMNVFKRKIIKDPVCSLCGEHVESVEQCLLLCPWTSNVWFGGPLGYIPAKARITNFDAWFLEVHKALSSENGDGFMMVCLHLFEIWKQRCNAMMKRTMHNPSATISNIVSTFANCTEAHEVDALTARVENSSRSANPNGQPHPVHAKVNVDAAWKNGSYNSVMRIVIRNQKGESVAGASLLSTHNSDVEAETEAVVKRLQLAAYHNLVYVVMEGDCLEVINALNDHFVSCNWRIGLMVRKAKELAAGFRLVIWNWVPRKANRIENVAAKLAMVRLSSSEWVRRPLASLVQVLRNDGLTGPPD